MATSGALLHSCAVYLYLYDNNRGSYTQQTNAAVGCALLMGESSSSAFSLLLYDMQKTPLLQLPLTPSVRFVPKKDNYVNFYDHQTKKNYAMRFKDAASSEAFLVMVALIKAQVLVLSTKSYAGQKPIVLVDQLAIGKGDAVSLTLGDVAGITLKKWHGTVEEQNTFFTMNPLDIRKQPTTEATGGSEVRRVKLVEYTGGKIETDTFMWALATEALIGMQKMEKRLVSVTVPNTKEWAIAEIELIKVKTNTKETAEGTLTQQNVGEKVALKTSSEKEEERTQNGRDLVTRMATLSRVGSQTSGLLASVQTKPSTKTNSEHTNALRRPSSSEEQSLDPPPGYVPVLLAGLQLPGEKPGSFPTLQSQNSAPHSEVARAGEPIDPLTQTTSFGNDSNMMSLSNDMERLMKEQSELAQLREQLEESKRKLQSEDISESAVQSVQSSGFGRQSASLTAERPSHEEHASSFAPSSFALASLSSSSTVSTSSSTWTPPKLDLVPSLPQSTVVPTGLPLALFPSSRTAHTNPSFSSPYSSLPASGSSVDLENGLIRLQRSSTTIESTLQDLQSKLDRLLNSQHSIKSTKFTGTSVKFSGSASFSSVLSSSSSSSMLLKNLEKALTQRDQLQEHTARLEEANAELESRVEDLQNQQEALQMENRTLLDKVQNGNHLQQEKFRLEVRTVQQQLSQSQEQLLVYQEENFQLRAELAAKDEQLAKEKAKLQEHTQKQIEHLQRHMEHEVRQGSKDLVERMATEKAALDAQVAELTAQKKQWELERDVMNVQLNQAQIQQVQLHDDSVKSQAAQNSRVRELIARIDQLERESVDWKQQAERFHSEAQHLEEQLVSKDHELSQLRSSRNDQEYAALSELFKELMNDIYFHFQDAFDEETEFTGKEIVMAIRKLLKHNTMDILAKLEEFYKQQAQR